MQSGVSATGIGPRLREIGARLGEAAHTRLELLAAELEALVATSLSALLAGLAAIGVALIAILALVCALALATPPSLRASCLALLGLVLAAIATFLFTRAARLRGRGAFASTLDELRGDLDALRTGREASSIPAERAEKDQPRTKHPRPSDDA